MESSPTSSPADQISDKYLFPKAEVLPAYVVAEQTLLDLTWDIEISGKKPFDVALAWYRANIPDCLAVSPWVNVAKEHAIRYFVDGPSSFSDHTLLIRSLLYGICAAVSSAGARHTLSFPHIEQRSRPRWAMDLGDDAKPRSTQNSP